MIKRLDDKVELYKLHVKHYHMSPTQFRRCTSMLNLPERIYEKYEDVFNKCRVCSMSVAPPPRAKISGIRASVFGDVVFVDHCEIELKKKKYVVLLVLDGATNLLWATAQNSLDKKETLTHLREGMNRTIAFQRPLLEMKLSFLMSSMSITSFMELKVYLVDQ